MDFIWDQTLGYELPRNRGLSIGGTMRINKDAVKKIVGMSSTKVDAIRLSPDELPADQKQKLKKWNQEIEKRLRTKKDLTIVILE